MSRPPANRRFQPSLFVLLSVVVVVLGVMMIAAFVMPSMRTITNPPPSSIHKISLICIHLEECMDRKTNITRQFPTSLFVVTFMNAVDTRHKKWKQYTSSMTTEAVQRLEMSLQNHHRIDHGDFSEGAVGCFLSHWECISQLADDDSRPFQLIIEDDTTLLQPTEQVFRLLHDVLSHLPFDADFAFFSYNVHSLIPVDHRWAILPPNHRFFQMDFYVVTRKGAKRFLDLVETTKMSHQIDTFLSMYGNKQKLQLYFLRFPLSSQSPLLPSTIHHLPVRS